MNLLTPAPENDLPDALATTLLSNLAAFPAFARRRPSAEQLAADAVQESLLRALRSNRKLSDEENVVARLCRILRNVLTDLHRRGAAQAKGLERFATPLVITSEGNDAELEQTCQMCARHGCLDRHCESKS